MPCVETVFVFSFGLGSGWVGTFLQFQDAADIAFRKIGRMTEFLSGLYGSFEH